MGKQPLLHRKQSLGKVSDVKLTAEGQYGRSLHTPADHLILDLPVGLLEMEKQSFCY